MPDDLFAGKRFKPGTAKTAEEEDDSGLSYRSRGQSVIRLGEADIFAAIDRLPSLPTVVTRILAQVGSQQSSAADLESLIGQDMVIAGRLMRLVNSPFYSLANPVASIAQAVSIIGFASLKSLVMAASVSNLLVLDLSAYGFDDQGLWKNSIATAGLARVVAQRTGVSRDEAEEYFLAGLMRDVGMLVLGPLLAKHGVALRRESGEEPIDILTRERKTLGFDHSWVGERIADRWLLPARLRQVVSCHHRIPTSAEAPELKQLAAVRLAERLIYAAGVGVLKNHPFDKRMDGVLIQAAGLDAAGFQSLMAEVPRIIAGAQVAL